MTFPALMPAIGAPADPFGLWDAATTGIQTDGAQAPGESDKGSVSFGLEQSPALDEQPVSIWTLDASDGAGQAVLDQRARQVAAIETGLLQADARLDLLLERRKRQSAAGGISFAAVDDPPAESELNFLLTLIETPEQAEAVSFGIVDFASEAVKNAAGATSAVSARINWSELEQKLDTMLGGVTRQLMYLALVNTTAEQRLVARTMVNWGGDVTTQLRPDLASTLVLAHQQSLSLALASRAANLRTVLTVAQVAGKIALAVSTPLGVTQALSLGWQFVNEVVMPLLKDSKQ